MSQTNRVQRIIQDRLADYMAARPDRFNFPVDGIVNWEDLDGTVRPMRVTVLEEPLDWLCGEWKIRLEAVDNEPDDTDRTDGR